jgi:hypothetical protein
MKLFEFIFLYNYTKKGKLPSKSFVSRFFSIFSCLLKKMLGGHYVISCHDPMKKVLWPLGNFFITLGGKNSWWP